MMYRISVDNAFVKSVKIKGEKTVVKLTGSEEDAVKFGDYVVARAILQLLDTLDAQGEENHRISIVGRPSEAQG